MALRRHPVCHLAVRLRLVRDPNVCAGHDKVGLTARELAGVRQFAAEPAVGPAVRTVDIGGDFPGPGAASRSHVK